MDFPTKNTRNSDIRMSQFRCIIQTILLMIRRKISFITYWFAAIVLSISILAGCALLTQMEIEPGPGEAEPAKIEWYESFEDAVEVARTQNKPMMVVLYGVSSKRLDERVFSDPDVIKLAQKFVCLRAGAGDAELNKRYIVEEFPTIVFADSQGGEYDRVIGYKSPQSFVQVLEAAMIPLEAEYDVQIRLLQPRSAVVKCIFRNVRGRSLVLTLTEKNATIFSLSYDSTDGRPGWEELEEKVWIMRFNTYAMKTVTIEYEVGLNVESRMSYLPEYVSYVGDDYGVLDGHALFLAPQDLYMVDKIVIHLDLPIDWDAIVPWDKSGDSSFTADSMEDVLDSAFCIGKFQFAKRQMEEHEVYVVFCSFKVSSNYLERMADKVVQIFGHYVMRFGDFPSKRYLAIFAGPDSERRHIIHGSAHRVGFAGPVNVDDSFIAHEIFHVWNGDVITQESEYEVWFKEGFTQYYGYLTPYRVGIYSKERFLGHLRRDYEEYLNRYEEGKDMALTMIKEKLARKEGHEQLENVRSWTMYHKGALVASLMDIEIRKLTYGSKTLDDLMYYMFHNFRDRRYSSEDVLKALNTVTDKDFTWFFSDFVYGRAKLPVEATGESETRPSP